jgi:glycosyltransferase involved in cell wall biosynthesis
MTEIEQKISVILPVYNAGIYLEEALESIFSQTVQPFEIIAINDGSTDNSLETLERYRSRLVIVSRENRGLSVTLNEAIRLSKGRLITFLDADDLWEPHKLELQLAFLASNPEKEACLGMIRQFISPELPENVKSTIYCPPDIQKGVLKVAMMVKSSAFHRIGWFDETLDRGDFIDWFSRAKEAGLDYSILPELIARRRLHRNSMSNRYQDEKDLVRLAKAVMDRRRVSGNMG